ncbi:MAG: cation channel family, partial [Trebouxia sp. A1-2]
MENAPKGGLDRMISIRSAEGDSYLDKHAGLISPQDNNALSRMVNRTVEVDEKGWTALHNNSQNAAKLSEDSSESVRVRTFGKGSEEKILFWRKGLPVINPYTRLYGWWCAFVLFTDATYTAFVVPIGVGFNTSSVQWDWVGYFDFIAGVTFAFELLLSWNVAFVATHNLRKRIVLKRSKIAQFYVWHSTFIFDFISTMVFVVQCIGYGLGSAGTGSGTIIQVIQILRALRLLRLMRLLQQLFVMSLTAPQTHVPLINRALPVWMSYLAQLLYIVGLFINFLACIWVFVAYREEMTGTWINNYSPFVSGFSTDADATTLTSTEARSIPGPDVYLAAAYWSLTTVSTIGFGDILPITNAERAVMLMSQITGVLFFGILLGSITSLLQRASQEVKDAQMFREKMTSVSEWMGRVKLPRELKTKIRAYYAEVWVRQTVVENDLNLFKELPTHLRAQVAWRSNKSIMDKLDTFQDLQEETLFMIAGRATPVKMAPGHEICSQGDPADCIWLLHEGDVIATYHYREAEVEKAPAIVGETALLAGSEGRYSVRPCGYRALTACVLWEITMQDLQPIVDWQEDVAEMLEAKARQHLLNRQSEHPHLWGMNSCDFEDAVKPGKDGGDNDGDSSEGDDEGIDAENSDMRHYSNGSDEFEIDRPSATLKHPRRSGKPYVIKAAKEDKDGVESRADHSSSTDALNTNPGTRVGTDPDSNHVIITMPSGNGNHCNSTLTRSSQDSTNTDDVAEPHDSAHSAPVQHRAQLSSHTTQAAADGDTAYGTQALRRGHLPTFSSQSDDGSLPAARSQQQAHDRAGIPSGGSQRLHTQAEHADEGERLDSQSPESHQHGQQGEQEQHPQQPVVAVANFVQLQQPDNAHNLQGQSLHRQGSQQGQRQQQQQQQQQEQLHPWQQQQQQQVSRRSRSYTQSPRRHLQKRPSRIQPGGGFAANVSSAQDAASSQRSLGRPSSPPNPSDSQTVLQSPFQTLSHAQTDVVPRTPTQPVDMGGSLGNGLLDAAESIKAAVQQMQQQLQG